MNYVHAINGNIIKYPYDISELKERYPFTLWPKKLTDEFLRGYDVHRVTVEQIPSVLENEIPERDNLPKLINGNWTLGWTVRNKTAEELAKDQKNRAAGVRNKGASLLKSIATPYTDEERETWAQQVNEAKAFVADANTAVTPLLDGLASGRGLTRAEIAAVIIGKSDAFSAAAGAILGAQSALLEMDPIPENYKDAQYWPDLVPPA